SVGSEWNKISEWSEKLISQCHALRDEINLFAALPGLTIHAALRDLALLTDASESIQKEAIHQAKIRMALIDTLAQQTSSLAQMDMSFLYNEASHLMTIGFNVDEQKNDYSSYDLLSSEARLGIFVAIAQGQILQE